MTRIQDGVTANVDRRRQAIIAHAARLFDANGYHSTSMSALADAVGISKPGLYYYFGSKQDILFAIHDEFIDLLILKNQLRKDLGLNEERMLLEVMCDILDLMDTHKGYVRTFFEQHRELSGDQRLEMQQKRDDYADAVVEIIQTGSSTGKFRRVDPTIVAFAIFGMCNWAYQWYQPNGRLTSRDIAHEFWQLALSGLGRDIGPSHSLWAHAPSK